MSELENPAALATVDRLLAPEIEGATIIALARRLYGLELDPGRAAALAQDVGQLIAVVTAATGAPPAIAADADFRHLLLRTARGDR